MKPTTVCLMETSMLTNTRSVWSLLLNLMNELQSDKISLDDIQRYYMKANIYLAHCEKLINVAEQQIIELNLDTL